MTQDAAPAEPNLLFSALCSLSSETHAPKLHASRTRASTRRRRVPRSEIGDQRSEQAAPVRSPGACHLISDSDLWTPRPTW